MNRNVEDWNAVKHRSAVNTAYAMPAAIILLVIIVSILVHFASAPRVLAGHNHNDQAANNGPRCRVRAPKDTRLWEQTELYRTLTRRIVRQ